MSAQDRAIQKLAKELAGIKREVVSWRSPQLDYSSIENSGNITFKDSDGNVTAIMGGQDDGSNTIRHVDGPTPPIPSGLSAHVDGPIVQVSWDGTFEDADTATWDWSHLEVVAVGPSNEQLTATINDITGASTNLAATSSGEWTVAARSVSRAEKRSLDGDAGTVDVKLVDIDGAIEAVQDSANGKNKVTYSEHAPTTADPGIFDDTWFVGQVGRPNDVVEAANLVFNPSFEVAPSDLSLSSGLASAVQSTDSRGILRGSHCLSVTGASSGISGSSAQIRVYTSRGVSAGEYLGWGWSLLDANAVGLTVSVGVNWYTSGGSFISSEYQSYRTVPTSLDVISSAFLAPTGTYRARMIIRFRASDGSSAAPANFNVLTDGWLASPAASQSSALAAVATYFDGDTPSGATDNESHYRWSGTPHASTSEKYLPALTIGDSDTWNVIEQYRHDGTGWVKVELSHYVFSSVDLGKATVGELDGIRIAAQTIRGEQLSGDAIDGKVITGPIIQSARDGQRWVGDTTGIRIFNADNEVRTQLSPDGSVFKGEVEADTLVVNGGSELRSTENKLAQGAKLTLAAGVTDPTAPPTVQPYWDATEFTPGTVNGEPMKSVGLAWDGTNYWTAHSRVGAGGASSRMIVFRIDVSTGSGSFVYITIPNGTPNHAELFGVTCIGSELFWLGRSLWDGMVWVTDLAGAFKRAFAYPDLGYTRTNPLGYKPGIGNDGTNVVVAHVFDAGSLGVRTYNKTTGAQIGATVKDSADLTRSDITGVYVGNADWGRKLVTVAKASTSELPSFSTTTGVYDGAATKFGAAATGSVGVVFHDGKFHTLDPAGKIHEYADSNTGDGSGDWWATYYWYTDVDDDSVIESSDYQSRMAPPKRFTWPRRAGLKILGQPMPTGVGALGPALAKKTTEPVRTDFSGPGWKADSGKPSARYVTLPTNWTTFASPSDTNTFPEATSSVLESASGTFRVQGDGSGRWGPLKMGRNGVMSGLIVRGQVAITPDRANTVKQVTVNLPAGRFSKPPVVWAQLNTSVPHWCSLGVYQPADTNNFDMFLVRTNTTTTDVYWFAMDSE